MQRFVAGILIVVGLIVFFTVGFTVYAQFALDYSLENLKEALEASRQGISSEPAGAALRSNLEGLVLEEIAKEDTDVESVVLLEHATRSIRDAVERSGYARAGVYLSEVLREKSSERNWLLRAVDAVYYFIQSFTDSARHFWSYLVKRLGRGPKVTPLTGTGMLILGEAERMEKEGDLYEAERYYQEFLDRYPGRPERGFVTISLAHVLTKMRRLDEATELLKGVQAEFPGAREEALAESLQNRVASVRKRLSRLPELEAWIKTQPDRIFREEGGLELALGYIATYQIDRALSLLKKLQEAPDPRIRAKALFFLGLASKWQGDFSEGKEIFQLLGEEAGLEDELNNAAQMELADVHYESKEYDEALNHYQQVYERVPQGSLKALSELEQEGIYLFRIGDKEKVRDRLEKLKTEFPKMSSEFKLARERLEEVIQKSLREDGFRALAEGRLDAAAEIFVNHLKKFPRDGQVHSALGSIHLLRGSLSQAVEEAEKGYGLQPDEYTASLLGYVYEKIGRLKEAEKYYSIGAKINPSYLIAQFNLAVIFLLTDRSKEADKILTELEKKSAPPAIRAKIFNNHGCAFWALGREKEAKAQFQEALKVVPGFPEAEANLKLGSAGQPAFTSSETPFLR